MRFLRRHFTPLSAADFLSCLDRGQFPRGACIVTFDDGWHDNETYALPIIKHLSLPIVVFVATGYVGTRRTFWQERMTRQLFNLSRLKPSLGEDYPTLAELGLGDACVAPAAEARRLLRNFVTQLKASSTAEIEQVAARLSAASQKAGFADTAIGDDIFLDWNALNRMHATGLVTIGSHAHCHVPLPRLGQEGAIADLQRSVREIERHEIPAPSICAYPNGDFNLTVLDCLKHAGLNVGFTTEHGYVKPSDDPRRLPRVNIHENAAATTPELLCRILGVF
jgi:peptidoglycan/xylan/chitin deacetylase (PgdA/CDA1 family)